MMNYEMGPKGVVNLHQEKVGAGTKLFVHFLKPELKAAFVPSFMKSFNLILNHNNLNLRIENSIFPFQVILICTIDFLQTKAISSLGFYKVLNIPRQESSRNCSGCLTTRNINQLSIGDGKLISYP